MEQKNYDKIRKLIGYFRYDTEEAVEIVNQLYKVEDLIANYFTATMKLKSKVVDNHGRVVRRVHEIPKTPYCRLLESKYIRIKVKQKVWAIKKQLNLVELRKKSDVLRRKLAKLASPVGDI